MYVDIFLHPMDNSHLVVILYNPFHVLPNSVCLYFLEDAFIGTHQGYWSETSLSGFGIRVMLYSQNEFGSVPTFSIFWKSLKRIHVNSSLNAS